MKKCLSVILAIILITCLFSSLAETKIVVGGSGETFVNADYAMVTLGVVSVQKEVIKAQSDVNETINKIRKALLESGIENENINTDQIRIHANYDYSGTSEKIVGYNASSSLTIRTNDMENVGAIIDTAFEAGANTLNGIEFYKENTDDARAESLTAAVQDARAKAEIIAKAAGLKITGINTITEGYSYTSESASNMYFKIAEDTTMAMGAQTIVQSAKLIVQANVNIEFSAE